MQYGSTPLIAAAASGHLDVVAMLIKHTVNIHHTDEVSIYKCILM